MVCKNTSHTNGYFSRIFKEKKSKSFSNIANTKYCLYFISLKKIIVMDFE